MNISIGTTFNYGIPIKDQLPLIKAAGFTHISLGADVEHSGYLDLSRRAELKKQVADHGLGICSVHAPFLGGMDFSSPVPDQARTSLDLAKRSLDAAVDLEAGALIFHPCSDQAEDDPRRKDVMTSGVIALFDHLGDRSLRLAAENLRSEILNEVLVHALAIIGSPRFGLCYDSSHDNLSSQPTALLRRCGGRLLATHISDNRGEKDDHLLPFEGKVDWDRFASIFSRVKYAGVFLLEVEMRESAFKAPSEFLREAFARGKKLLQLCGQS